MKLSKNFLTVLHIGAWIIFVGVCIEAAGFITSTISTIALDPERAKHFWHQVDLSSLYNYDKVEFLIQSVLICLVALLRVVIFYLIIMFLHKKKIDISRPFSNDLTRFTQQIAYLSIFTGILSAQGAKFAARLEGKGISLPDIENMRLGGADVWLFMGLILLVIAQVFKKGIEIQSENELTV